jgi:hypothetical protein
MREFALVIVGAVAQLGERLHGMEEVAGPIPVSSTKQDSNGPSHVSEFLGMRVNMPKGPFAVGW